MKPFQREAIPDVPSPSGPYLPFPNATNRFCSSFPSYQCAMGAGLYAWLQVEIPNSAVTKTAHVDFATVLFDAGILVQDEYVWHKVIHLLKALIKKGNGDMVSSMLVTGKGIRLTCATPLGAQGGCCAAVWVKCSKMGRGHKKASAIFFPCHL